MKEDNGLALVPELTQNEGKRDRQPNLFFGET